MIAALALELLLIGLAAWQLVVMRRSLRADREKDARDSDAADAPEAFRPRTEADAGFTTEPARKGRQV